MHLEYSNLNTHWKQSRFSPLNYVTLKTGIALLQKIELIRSYRKGYPDVLKKCSHIPHLFGLLTHKERERESKSISTISICICNMLLHFPIQAPIGITTLLKSVEKFACESNKKRAYTTCVSFRLFFLLDIL